MAHTHQVLIDVYSLNIHIAVLEIMKHILIHNLCIDTRATVA